MTPQDNIVNWEQLDAIADGWPPDFVEIFQEFLAELPTELLALQAALESGSAGDAQSHAHRLKGSAANFGFEGVQRAAAEIEALARQGSLEGAGEFLQRARDADEAARREVKARTGHP